MSQQGSHLWQGASSDSRWLMIAQRAGVAPGVVVATITALIDHASNHHTERGRVDDFCIDSWSAFSGFPAEDIARIIDKMSEGTHPVIVDGMFTLLDYRKASGGSTSAERMRRHRARKKAEANSSRNRPSDVTPSHPYEGGDGSDTGDVTPSHKTESITDFQDDIVGNDSTYADSYTGDEDVTGDVTSVTGVTDLARTRNSLVNINTKTSQVNKIKSGKDKSGNKIKSGIDNSVSPKLSNNDLIFSFDFFRGDESAPSDDVAYPGPEPQQIPLDTISRDEVGSSPTGNHAANEYSDGASPDGGSDSTSAESTKFTPEHYAVATLLVDLMCERNPRQKRPTEKRLREWADQIRLMVERDNIEMDELVAVLEWSQRDEFWGTVIRSTPKFRDKYARLWELWKKDGAPKSRHRVSAQGETTEQPKTELTEETIPLPSYLKHSRYYGYRNVHRFPSGAHYDAWQALVHEFDLLGEAELDRMEDVWDGLYQNEDGTFRHVPVEELFRVALGEEAAERYRRDKLRKQQAEEYDIMNGVRPAFHLRSA